MVYRIFQILQDFPEELRGDVSMHLHNEILGLPIFDTAPEGCKKLLSIKVQIHNIAENSQLIVFFLLTFYSESFLLIKLTLFR